MRESAAVAPPAAAAARPRLSGRRGERRLRPRARPGIARTSTGAARFGAWPAGSQANHATRAAVRAIA